MLSYGLESYRKYDIIEENAFRLEGRPIKNE